MDIPNLFTAPYKQKYNADGSPTDPAEKASRQEEIRKRVLAQQAARRGDQAPGPEAPQQANGQQAAQDAPERQPAMHPAQLASPLQRMVEQTNTAFRNEMASRVRQAEAERDRQHEYDMASLHLQAKGGRQQQEYQEPQQTPGDEVRRARNRSLLGMAGLGGYTIQSGSGGTNKTPHPFGNNPFADALLGD